MAVVTICSEFGAQKNSISLIPLLLHLTWSDGTRKKKVGLKLNIQKTKIMASDSITWLQIDGKTVEGEKL